MTKADACQMEVSGMGLTAMITIHTVTNMYRESLDGWGSDHTTLRDALDAACRRIIEKAGRPSAEELCKGMDAFYGKLGKE